MIITKLSNAGEPGPVAQLVTSPTADPVALSHTFVEIDHEII